MTMTDLPPTAGILEGIKVVECSTWGFGPLCGVMLGDLGADVVKIESPTAPDGARAMIFAGGSAAQSTSRVPAFTWQLAQSQPSEAHINPMLARKSSTGMSWSTWTLSNTSPAVSPGSAAVCPPAPAATPIPTNAGTARHTPISTRCCIVSCISLMRRRCLFVCYWRGCLRKWP